MLGVMIQSFQLKIQIYMNAWVGHQQECCISANEHSIILPTKENCIASKGGHAPLKITPVWFDIQAIILCLT